MTEHTFKSWDGADIFYRAWAPPNLTSTSKSILLFHRGHEHSARWQSTVDALTLPDCAVYAWDQRGHGRSSGPRGHAPNLAAVAKDADLFARHLIETRGLSLENTVVIAHSVGAVIATAWVHDFAPPVRALVLATPAFRVRLYVPLAVPLLRLKQKLLGPGVVKSYVKADMLTHDPAEAAAYTQDPLIFREIAVNMLLDLHDTSTRLIDDAGAITVPTLVLSAGADWVVSVNAQKDFYRKLGSRTKQFEVLPGFYHAIFHESRRAEAVNRIRAFLTRCFDTPAPSPASDPALLDADRGGHTRTEYDLLRAPGSRRWSVIRAALKTGGQLSRGIRLGWQTGFDSGSTLDYVYQNSSRGISLLGKLIDRIYLSSIGWRGIRTRRDNLQSALRRCIQQTHDSGRPVRILDIACGGGRYALESLHALPAIPSSAHLRDYQQLNLDAARALADRLALKHITTERADAFDRDSIAATNPRPTIAIVSGLYELFPENAPLRRSLDGLAAALDPGATLIYTCQPWHPQMEFIARVLTNREGQPWIMRRRTQAEMDALVTAAGFEKVSEDIDPWGIFTVSVARRISP